MQKLFGTDGVRGVANSELTPELALNLGRTGVYVLTKEKKHVPKILLCKDTRLSGCMLESALAAGMCSMGAEVYLAGVLPTPAVPYLVRKHGFDAGAVITASHNLMADNGIKLFNEDGYKLPDNIEEEIEALCTGGAENLERPIGTKVGKIKEFPNAFDDYCNFLVSAVSDENEEKPLTGLRIAIDCANGSTYKVAPTVLHRLGAVVVPCHNTPNGYNINAECGSTHMDSLTQLVLKTGADIGLAFDGDGDRMLAVDELGNTVHGDEIMSICGHHLFAEGKLKANTMVATVMSNLGLYNMTAEHGITIETTGVGDRYVLEKMLAHGYSFGGENSGHIIFLDHNTTGDGILTGLYLLKILKNSGRKFSQLNTLMERLPQVLVGAKVDNAKKYSYLENSEIKTEIEKLEERFAGNGRILIRPSGTEPLVRVMIEGRDQELLTSEANRIATLIEKLLA